MTEDPTVFTLPLSREAFADALKKGLGRALLHAKAHGLAGVEDVFLDACEKNLVFDVQCECVRTEWLIEIARVGKCLSGLDHRVARASKILPYGVDLYQVEDILLSRAKTGNQQYRQSLYALLERTRCWQKVASPDVSQEKRSEPEVCGISSILELDGIDGIQRIATAVSRHPSIDEIAERTTFYLESEGDSILDELRWISAQFVDDENVQQMYALAIANRDELKHERDIERSLLKLANNQRRDIPELSNADVTEPRKLESYLRAEVRKMDDAQLLALGELFNSERQESVLERALLSFGKKQVPPNIFDRLYDIVEAGVKYQDSNLHTGLVRRASAALGRIKDDRVRSLALESIALKPSNLLAYELLDANYQPKDDKVLLAGAKNMLDICDHHWLLMHFVEMQEHLETLTSVVLMQHVYANTPCTNCREIAVKLLRKHNICPPHMEHEFAFDCVAFDDR